MKIKNKLFTGLICLSVLIIAACGGKDDDEPSTPAPTGTFTGQLTNEAGEVSTWVATSATAVLDTSLFGGLTITAKNASGDIIIVELTDNDETAHLMSSVTSNYSYYTTSDQSTIATTETDDGSTANQGNLTITDNGDSDNLVKGSGSDNFIRWFIVDPVDDDATYGVMENISFSVPLTRTGFEIGGDASVAVDIDGSPFTSTFTTSITQQGIISVIGSGVSGTVSITIPNGATTGNHDLSQLEGYSVSYISASATVPYMSTSGTMNISAVNSTAGTVTGTFTCTITDASSGDTKSMTNGSFNVD